MIRGTFESQSLGQTSDARTVGRAQSDESLNRGDVGRGVGTGGEGTGGEGRASQTNLVVRGSVVLAQKGEVREARPGEHRKPVVKLRFVVHHEVRSMEL